MAATKTDRYVSSDLYIFDLAFVQAETTSGNVAHGLGAIPLDVTFSFVAQGNVYSDWAWVADATNIVVTKTIVAAAGNTGTLRFRVARNHHQGL